MKKKEESTYYVKYYLLYAQLHVKPVQWIWDKKILSQYACSHL